MAITLDYEMDVPDLGTVPYALAHLSDNSYAGPEITASWEQSASASMTYFCNWADLHDFVGALVGDNKVIEDGDIKRYSRVLPHQFPVKTIRNLWCSGVTSIKGIPGPGPDPTDSSITNIYPIYSDLRGLEYRYAAVTAKYEPSIWPMLKDSETPYNKEWKRFTSITKTPRLEFLQIPAGTLYWVDNPEVAKQSALPHNIPIREQSVDWIVTFHRVPDTFFGPDRYIGYTNDADGFLAGHPQVAPSGFDKDTMLLLGINEIILPTCFREDEPYYTLQFLFQERSNTHNKVRRLRTDVTPPTWDYTKYSLDGLTPTTNATRAFKQIGMTSIFLPNAV